jgi:hypothetical protein
MNDNNDKHRYHHFSIELDCPPGEPRPKHLIGGVLDGTGLNEADFETANPFFGNQCWVLKQGSQDRDDAFIKAKPIFAGRIEALHDAGIIRYGSW